MWNKTRTYVLLTKFALKIFQIVSLFVADASNNILIIKFAMILIIVRNFSINSVQHEYQLLGVLAFGRHLNPQDFFKSYKLEYDLHIIMNFFHQFVCRSYCCWHFWQTWANWKWLSPMELKTRSQNYCVMVWLIYRGHLGQYKKKKNILNIKKIVRLEHKKVSSH